MMGELGIIDEVIERRLNHVEQNKLKRIYQRYELKNEKYDAWGKLGMKLATLINSNKNEQAKYRFFLFINELRFSNRLSLQILKLITIEPHIFKIILRLSRYDSFISLASTS